MAEEMLDVESSLGKKKANELLKLNKAELTNRLVLMILRNRVQDRTISSLENENEKVNGMLEKAEFYVEQARAMIKSVMERWYHYDL